MQGPPFATFAGQSCLAQPRAIDPDHDDPLTHVDCMVNRYIFEVAIPKNHRQRLDLTARLTTFPDGTAPAQEGLLGRTIEPLIGTASASQDLKPGTHRANILQEWSKEKASFKISPSIEARLRRNYRVTNLWSKDSGRSAHEHTYGHVKFLVSLEPLRNVVNVRHAYEHAIQHVEDLTSSNLSSQNANEESLEYSQVPCKRFCLQADTFLCSTPTGSQAHKKRSWNVLENVQTGQLEGFDCPCQIASQLLPVMSCIDCCNSHCISS